MESQSIRNHKSYSFYFEFVLYSNPTHRPCMSVVVSDGVEWWNMWVADMIGSL